MRSFEAYLSRALLRRPLSGGRRDPWPGRARLALQCFGLSLASAVLSASENLPGLADDVHGRALEATAAAPTNYVDKLPKQWYTGTPVLDALLFDPRAKWWSWLVAAVLVIAASRLLGCFFDCCCGPSRLMNFSEIGEVAVEFYKSGLLLHLARRNLTLAIAVAVIATGIGSILVGALYAYANAQRFAGEDGAPPRVITLSGTLTAKSVYENVQIPFPRVVATFVIQVALGMVYCYSLNSSDLSKIKIENYYLAVLLAVPFDIQSQSDRDATSGFWTGLLDWVDNNRRILDTHESASEVLTSTVTTGEKPTSFRMSSCEFRLRRIMSNVVNIGMPVLLWSTLPLLLSLSDKPIDFVKDAMSTVFIVQLDDLNSDVTLQLDLSNPEDSESQSESELSRCFM